MLHYEYIYEKFIMDIHLLVTVELMLTINQTLN